MPTYIGFSTVALTNRRKYTLLDKDLIRQDLLNALSIRPGSLVMQPSIGCIVWDSLFEPLTVSLINDIKKNISDIINNDLRIALKDINVTQDTNSITVAITILYVQTNQVETMALKFDSQSTLGVNYQ